MDIFLKFNEIVLDYHSNHCAEHSTSIDIKLSISCRLCIRFIDMRLATAACIESKFKHLFLV
jgi:hypothetical protein